MHRREVLTGVHHSRDGAEALDVRLDAGLAVVVKDRHLRQVSYLPARGLDSAAEVGLVAVHEEALVEAAGALERLATGEHERAARPVAGELPLLGARIDLALA